jgi:fumarylacetoacetate (FAA) hydrolase family protein
MHQLRVEEAKVPKSETGGDAQGMLPRSAAAVVVGRAWVPGEGPVLVTVRGQQLVDITRSAGPTMSDLLDRSDAVEAVRTASGQQSWPVDEVLDATAAQDANRVHLISPFDLQALKAAGVTFAKSMVERVIEERAKGDPARADELRTNLADVIAQATSVVPGSAAAAEIKKRLQAEDLWSQYLEVGIGPDPEIFTKGQPLSSVGPGASVGVLERSVWNNPEPEIVLAVSSTGEMVGATLGNDVNLRDFEGRSALLLTEAKDNNASCALGPLIRLFDEEFTPEQLRTATVSLSITGEDGFVLNAESRVGEMSRGFDELVSHAWGLHHQYPDGFALMTGTMFAPTEDRDASGQGFTHHRGDVVSISTELLGTLTNTVSTAEETQDWIFGARALMKNLNERGLIV